MKGYIKRLSQDIAILSMKRQAISDFKGEIDDTQRILLHRQYEVMGELLNVMKSRLGYERKIHPNYFEDLPFKEDGQLSLDFDTDEEIIEE